LRFRVSSSLLTHIINIIVFINITRLPSAEGGHQQFELFPNPSQVTITGSSPSSPSILSNFNNNNNNNDNNNR